MERRQIKGDNGAPQKTKYLDVIKTILLLNLMKKIEAKKDNYPLRDNENEGKKTNLTENCTHDPILI